MIVPRVQMFALAAASLLTAEGVALAQGNPWRIDPGVGANGAQSGMQAFEQGFQRGFEQGLRAGQGIGASQSGPAAAAAAGTGALPSTGASGWIGGGSGALGHGAGYPGDLGPSGVIAPPRGAARWGDFPPLGEADEEDRRRGSQGVARRRSAPPRERQDTLGERERTPPAPPPPAAYPYPYPGYGYGYGYGGYGLPPGYAAGPSTFGSPYGGLGGPALVPGGIGIPGVW